MYRLAIPDYKSTTNWNMDNSIALAKPYLNEIQFCQ